MSGALHLIPVGLGDAPPERWLPADVRALAAGSTPISPRTPRRRAPS